MRPYLDIHFMGLTVSRTTLYMKGMSTAVRSVRSRDEMGESVAQLDQPLLAGTTHPWISLPYSDLPLHFTWYLRYLITYTRIVKRPHLYAESNWLNAFTFT